MREDHHYDDTSLGFFNSSFDSFSDTGGAFGIGTDEAVLPQYKQLDGVHLHGGTSRIFPSSSIPRGSEAPSPSDIALPDLKIHTDFRESSELSVGDMSPIKLIYTNDRTPKIERRSSQFLVDDHCEAGSVLPVDWRNETNHLYSDRSNPFFVLRSARKAFENVQYLLPCLQSSIGEAGTINVSNLGSILHYRDRKVRTRNYCYRFGLSFAFLTSLLVWLS
jgi:hypothetical protein